jgi:hypothetical protein
MESELEMGVAELFALAVVKVRRDVAADRSRRVVS